MRRGRIRRRTRHNLLLRLRDHKGATLRFLFEPNVPFTNNQAERDLRMMKIRQKISGGFRSETGAQTFATLRTVLSTSRKQGWNILATLTTSPAVLTQNLRTA
jgi:transposase